MDSVPGRKVDAVVVEQTKAGDFPVGSLIESEAGGRVLYRDIDSKKHVFKAGDYQGLSVDNAVVEYLEKNGGCGSVEFFLKDKQKVLSTSFANYSKVKPKRMRGRLQRIVGLSLFQEREQQHPRPRPNKSVFVEVEE